MGKLASTAALVLALAAPASASAGVGLAGNANGDQVLFHTVDGHYDRPLVVGTRPGGGTFGPLAPISPLIGASGEVAAVDDSGGSVLVWTTPASYTSDSHLQASIRPPNGHFGPAVELGSAAMGLHVASNGRGDTVVVWDRYNAPSLYSFRLAGGDFGPAAEAPAVSVGVSVDPDGTANFYGVEFGSDESWLTMATRPPGGEVGAPRRVVESVPSFDPQVGAARNGRVLVAWPNVNPGASAVTLAERAPGGDFGPLHDVQTPSPVDVFGIRSVQVASSGAAALSLGDGGDRVISRDPGGQFVGSPLFPVANLQVSSIAVDEQGDTAVAWRGLNGNGIRAAYRPSGTGEWSAAQVLSRRRYAAGLTIASPGLVIDATGTATAAWDEDDFETVRTFTRDFRASSAQPKVLVDSVPAYSRAGPPSACRVGKLIRKTARAIVFEDRSHTVYGCLLARGAPVQLGVEREVDHPTRTLALAGPLVAFGWHYSDRLDDIDFMSVADLRDRDSGNSRLHRLESSSDFATLLATRLRANGAVAWISCPDASVDSRRARKCRRVGADPKHVWVWGTGASAPRLVDRGRVIRPRTFRLRGSLLSWRHGGKLRHARLR
jgi:hypothetical protein